MRLFGEKGYRVLAKSDPGEVTVYATKGIMGRIGAHVAHLSATVIVLGGLLGSYYGFQEFGVCLEGRPTTFRGAILISASTSSGSTTMKTVR